MTSITGLPVFVIIPYYNEISVIRKVVVGIPEGYNIVLVDDGSVISPKTVLQGLKNLHVIRHKVNLGQGAAIQTGLEYALKNDAGLVITFDADGQHSPHDFPAILEPLLKGEADITLGSRFLGQQKSNATLSRKFILKAGRWVNYFFTGLYLSDSHNGLRGMTRATASLIQLKENRMAHATEILFIIRKSRLKFKEVPVTVTYTDYSKKKGQSVFNSVRIFFDLVLHKLFE